MSTEVKITLKWSRLLVLLGLIRATPASVVGGAKRLEVVDKIHALDKAIPEATRGDRAATLGLDVNLILNREHLGALKLCLLEMWGGKDSNGLTQEQIADTAKALRIWHKHIIPALPKDEIPTLDELDDEADMTDLDEEQG